VIRRLRELLATPFARPPGRRSVWTRFAPEWCAAAVYLAFGAVLAWQRPEFEYQSLTEALFKATSAAYALAGCLLLVVPVAAAAASLAAERRRGTAEAAVLSAHDHAAQAWGRFLWLVLPWGRLLLYLLPIYGVIAANNSLDYGGGSSDYLGFVAMSCVAPKPAVLILGWGFGHELGRLHWHAVSFLVLVVRPLSDASILLFAAAWAYHISARSRSTVRSLVLSGLGIPAVLLTALSADSWWILGVAAGYLDAVVSLLNWFALEEETFVVSVYAALGGLLLVLRFGLAFWLVRRVARNFDAWMLGEKPGKE